MTKPTLFVDAASLAEIGCVDRAVRVEALGETESDLLAGFTRDPKTWHAREILAQVEHVID